MKPVPAQLQSATSSQNGAHGVVKRSWNVVKAPEQMVSHWQARSVIMLAFILPMGIAWCLYNNRPASDSAMVRLGKYRSIYMPNRAAMHSPVNMGQPDLTQTADAVDNGQRARTNAAVRLALRDSLGLPVLEGSARVKEMGLALFNLQRKTGEDADKIADTIEATQRSLMDASVNRSLDQVAHDLDARVPAGSITIYSIDNVTKQYQSDLVLAQNERQQSAGGESQSGPKRSVAAIDDPMGATTE